MLESTNPVYVVIYDLLYHIMRKNALKKMQNLKKHYQYLIVPIKSIYKIQTYKKKKYLSIELNNAL